MRSIVLTGLLAVTCGGGAWAAGPADAGRVMVIGHRGASGLRPEHTLASYAKAIEDGADFIEPDLVPTKDGVLVARHENEIGGTTDVASHPEFAARKSRKVIDGNEIEGWFTEDFTLAELKTLRMRERLPQLRGTRFDGQFQIVSIDEIIDFTAAESAGKGRIIGLIPEIKHGTYFRKIGLAMEDKLLDTLAAHEYTRRAPVIIQSFEISNLKYLHGKLGSERKNIDLVQLLEQGATQPGDVLATGGKLTYADMRSPAGLREIATYATWIGPDKTLIIPVMGDALGQPTTLVHDAHAAGLKVMPYTFRPEQQFLPKALWLDGNPGRINAKASIVEIRAFIAAGIDAFFTDDPSIGGAARGAAKSGDQPAVPPV